MNVWAHIVMAGIIAGMAACVGCSGQDRRFARVAVHGEVFLDDRPLPNGSLSFVPQSSGPASGASVVDGSFQIERQRGPTLGQYWVRITAEVSKPSAHEALRVETDPPAEIPPLSVAITADGEALSLHFRTAPQ